MAARSNSNNSNGGGGGGGGGGEGKALELVGANGWFSSTITEAFDHCDVSTIQRIVRTFGVDAQDSVGTSLLMQAAVLSVPTHRARTVGLLLEYGATISLLDEEEDGEFHSLVITALQEYETCILDGVVEVHSPNAVDGNGWSLLICAVHNSSVDSVRYLINNGAAVHYKDNQGNTALHIAAANKSSEAMFLLLLRAGADPQALNNNKQTPRDLYNTPW